MNEFFRRIFFNLFTVCVYDFPLVPIQHFFFSVFSHTTSNRSQVFFWKFSPPFSTKIDFNDTFHIDFLFFFFFLRLYYKHPNVEICKFFTRIISSMIFWKYFRTYFLCYFFLHLCHFFSIYRRSSHWLIHTLKYQPVLNS